MTEEEGTTLWNIIMQSVACSFPDAGLDVVEMQKTAAD